MVAPRPFFSAATADRLTVIRQRGQVTAMRLWRDQYEVRRTDRPYGWEDGEADENAQSVESGTCKLRTSGPGPGDTTDAVIVNLTPYTVDLPVETTLTDTGSDLLVINGREFLVRDVSRGDVNSLIVTASLTERT